MTMNAVKVADLLTLTPGTRVHVLTTKAGRPRIAGDAVIKTNDGKDIEYQYETGEEAGLEYSFNIKRASLGMKLDDPAVLDEDSYSTTMYFLVCE